MSQIQLTPEERVQALQRFGYFEKEARFLCLAALHGGYFLRRQYDQFLGQKDGGAAAKLVEKAVALNHIQIFTHQHKTHIHHLCTRPFYEALGQEDNRNRRQRQPLTIKNKLMGLDFVLAHPDHTYLATEKEKLDYFAGTLGLSAAVLPAKLYRAVKGRETTARYFVDKYPQFTTDHSAPALPPVVSFCYVDEGMTTLSRFETYLAQYSGLFGALRQFRVIYVAATPGLFAGAARVFDDFVKRSERRQISQAVDPEMRRMLDHFQARKLYESKQLGAFDRAKLIRFRDEREEFRGPEIEALYTRWTAGDDGALLVNDSPERATGWPMQGCLETHLLEHRYDLFGNLTAF